MDAGILPDSPPQRVQIEIERNDQYIILWIEWEMIASAFVMPFSVEVGATDADLRDAVDTAICRS